LRMPSWHHVSDDARKRTVTVAGYWNSRKRIINPEKSKKVWRWDVLMVMALLLVCFLSPYEAGFLMDDKDLSFLKHGGDWIFWLNRLMDLLFIADMVLQFFIMYPVVERFGIVWVSDPKLIVRRYLTSWFGMDLVSVLPFDILGLLVSSGDVSKLRLIRSVRMLRLLKLVRLLRGVRIFARWESELSISYRRALQMNLFFTVCVAAHWMSCILGLVSAVQGNACLAEGLDEPPGCTRTWFTVFAADIVARGQEVTPWRSYVAAFHVTTTIIVHPYADAGQASNTWEQVAFSTLLFVAGFVWTRIICRTTALMTWVDRHGIFFKQTMDNLNANASDFALPHELQRRLRGFFTNSRDVSQRNAWLEITTRMTPSLQADVAVDIHSTWLSAAPFLRGCSPFFIAELAKAVETESHAQGETFGKNFHMYCIYRGVAMRTVGPKSRLRVMLPRAPWGMEHLVFTSPCLLEPNTATACSFSEVLMLSREVFDQVRMEFPESERRIRGFYVKMVVIRGILKVAQDCKVRDPDLLRAAGSMEVTGSTEEEGEDDSGIDPYRSHAMRMQRDLRRRIDGIVREPSAPAAAVAPRCRSEDLRGLEQRLTQRFEEGLDRMAANLRSELSAELQWALLDGALACPISPFDPPLAVDLENMSHDGFAHSVEDEAFGI